MAIDPANIVHTDVYELYAVSFWSLVFVTRDSKRLRKQTNDVLRIVAHKQHWVNGSRKIKKNFGISVMYHYSNTMLLR